MKKRDKQLIWLIGISLILIITFLYFFQNDTKMILITTSVGLASAIICWSLSFKIKSNSIVAYLIGFITGFFGLLFYLIYYFIKKIFVKKEDEERKKEKEKHGF